jgi:hypothetical protein
MESALLYQRNADDAGKDKEEDGEDFDESAEQGPQSCMLFIARRKNPLDNRLIRTPVPDSENGITEKYGIPGQPRWIAFRRVLDAMPLRSLNSIDGSMEMVSTEPGANFETYG